jgi:hypothetical protein
MDYSIRWMSLSMAALPEVQAVKFTHIEVACTV